MLIPESCRPHVLATEEDDIAGALEWLADEVGAAGARAVLQEAGRPDLRTGELTIETIGAAIGNLLPENAIVSDESIRDQQVFAQIASLAWNRQRLLYRFGKCRDAFRRKVDFPSIKVFRHIGS